MTDSKRIFLDTAPVIYYLQRIDLYYKKMKAFWLKNKQCEYVTSVVTVTEYLTFPYRQSDMGMILSFYAFLEGMDVEVMSINKSIAVKAAQIRAEYKHFKTMDALQLATACMTGCDLFLTNDKQLRQFTEIKCMTVDELE